MNQNSQPIEHIRFGAITVAVWENQGEHGTYHTASLSRTYRDADGAFVDTGSLRKQDLLVAAEALREAYRGIVGLESL